MKKVLLLLVLIIAFTSCNENESLSVEPTSSIQAVIATSQDSNQSRTDVKQDGIHAWVKDVTIIAESTETGHVSQDTFDLIALGEAGYNQASAVFNLDNVALGDNNISASSTTDVIGVTEFSTVPSGVSKNDWIMNHVDNTSPYAVYSTDSPVSVDVLQSGTAAISLPMNTKNARLVSAISVGNSDGNNQYITDNFTAVLTTEVKYPGGGWNVVPHVSGAQSTVITHESFASFYINDEYSVGGTIVKFTVAFSKNNGELVSQRSRTVTLSESVSYRCNFRYLVETNELFGDIEMSLIWQDWTESPCPGC